MNPLETNSSGKKRETLSPEIAALKKRMKDIEQVGVTIDENALRDVVKCLFFDDRQLGAKDQKEYRALQSQAEEILNMTSDGFTVKGVKEILKYSNLTDIYFFDRVQSIISHTLDSLWMLSIDWNYLPEETKESIRDSLSSIRAFVSSPEHNYYLSAYIRNITDDFENLRDDVSQVSKVVQVRKNQSLLGGKLSPNRADDQAAIQMLEKKYFDFIRSHEYQEAIWDESPSERQETFLQKEKEYEAELASHFALPLTRELFASGFEFRNLSPEKQKRATEDYIFFMSSRVRSIIEKDLGVQLVDFSIPEQYHMLAFMQTQTNESMSRVRQFSKKYGSAGLRTFLSLEHAGKKFGEKILDMSETLPKEQAESIFGGYGKLIDASSRVRAIMGQAISDPGFEQFPAELSDALLLRAKDILVGSEKIASGELSEKFDAHQVVHALEGITKLLDIVSDLKTAQSYQVVTEIYGEQNFKYAITDAEGYDYALKIFIRPFSEQKAQARINLELSFDTANPNTELQTAFVNRVVSHTQGKTTLGSTLRVGLDRETHGNDANLSLDVGRSEHSDDALTRSGDVLGRLLQEASASGHHSIETFSKKWADEKTFAQIANSFSSYLRDLPLK
jgi:hypothetical protein